MVAFVLLYRAEIPIPNANRIAHVSARKKLVVTTSLSPKSEPLINRKLAVETTINSAQISARAAIWM